MLVVIEKDEARGFVCDHMQETRIVQVGAKMTGTDYWGAMATVRENGSINVVFRDTFGSAPVAL